MLARTYISLIERGINSLTTRTVAKLARSKLMVRMEQLLAGGKRRLLARTLRIDSFYPEGIMRDTKYATELCEPGRVQWEDSEGRIERILVKASGQEEIRFSWWKNGTIATRPLDLPEEDLIALMRSAIESGVFTHRFRSELRALLDSTM